MQLASPSRTMEQGRPAKEQLTERLMGLPGGPAEESPYSPRLWPSRPAFPMAIIWFPECMPW
ncbi:hypothetical protein JZ751_024514 [Albula glossodonta]|uniref:Uncharacterized protein n=1 Tax=Albula glossodonta TaxID=121402 RepID=A0A8T2PDL2_9TELE|nr:hypothetical protein JZ751_024514 [Albula glossodonta]